MDLSLNNHLLYSSVLATVISLLLWWYAYHSPWSVLDQQNSRSLHHGHTLTGAGLLMFLPISLLGLILFPQASIAYVILLLSVLGFIDDRHDISFQLRLLIQIVSALATLYYFVLLTPVALAVFLVVALLWWVNLFNFMDGANGMAGLHGLVTLVFYGFYYATFNHQDAFIAYLITISCMAIAIYLVFNMKLKKLFMGDSGSLPLAWIIAITALYGLANNSLNYFQIAVIHSVFIIDTTLTMINRIKQGDNITQAHATHLYQRLIKLGYSHSKVSTGYASITAACCWLVWMTQNQSWTIQFSMFLLVYLTLAVLFMKFLNTAR